MTEGPRVSVDHGLFKLTVEGGSTDDIEDVIEAYNAAVEQEYERARELNADLEAAQAPDREGRF